MVNLDLMLKLHKYWWDLNLKQHRVVNISYPHTGIHEYLASSRGYPYKNESIVIMISGNWE